MTVDFGRGKIEYLEEGGEVLTQGCQLRVDVERLEALEKGGRSEDGVQLQAKKQGPVAAMTGPKVVSVKKGSRREV